ncbi:MAG TPA: glycosyltransferase family 2 protein [Parafilimonas sp.]|jgi:GT2 family glycosyltransferase|nr:glycosyltransferase family 2 protein [Parafilimonas sp.]
MKLSIIIVSFNVKYFLEQCLHSVEAACKNIETEIFVIDNASHDNTVEYLQPKFPFVNFLKNNLNKGFAKANNKALQLAIGEYILYLNPDTIIAEDTLLNCVQFLNKNKNAGVIGVKLIDGSGNFLPESKRAFPSIIASFFKMSGLASLFSRSAFFNRYALGNLDKNIMHEVDILPGAFFMASRNILLQLNGFDEDFFMYGEDIDLSYRIKQAGYKNYYLGNLSIIHFKGESMQTNKTDYVKNFYEAMKIFARKHYNKQSAIFLNITIALSQMIASVKHRFLSTKKEKNNSNFLLVGNDADTTSAEKILLHYNKSFQKINSLNQLNKPSLSKTNPAIVFCIGNLSYRETISFIQKNKNKYAYFWHKANSKSITGSNYSSTSGEIYASI